MPEMWLFIGTLAIGGIWIAVAPFMLGKADRAMTYCGGRLIGMRSDEIKELMDAGDHHA